MANTTWSPTDKNNITLSGGNLVATATASLGWVRATDRQAVGKFYWEITATTFAQNSSGTGVAASWVSLASGLSGVLPETASINRTGVILIDGATSGISLGTITSGTVICVAIDLTARRIWFRLGAAGNWNNNAANSPATNVGGIACNSLGNGIPVHPTFFGFTTAEAVTANFGDTAFTGAVPSGFTSGFTAGASVPTNALASQALAEHWLTTSPDARITSVVAEHWASVASDNLQAVVTQVLVEHWASVASVSPAAGGPIVTMIH
jgi:hypothetical protein